MKHTLKDQCIALAGIYQAVRLVQLTAQGERRDADATQASLQSIFNTDPESVIAVYGDPRALVVGLQTLVSQLANEDRQRDMVLTGYVVTLMHLERKLSGEPDLLARLAEAIEKIKGEINSSDEVSPEISVALASVYTDTISTLQPRIMVKGEESVLRNVDSQNMIRALLLAGMRATVLWKQCGGSRIRLIFQRRRILETCRLLLQQAGDPV
jgi:high frequency lysogenization protein